MVRAEGAPASTIPPSRARSSRPAATTRQLTRCQVHAARVGLRCAKCIRLVAAARCQVDTDG
eukprot:2512717-Prymnesium_polylepis.2